MSIVKKQQALLAWFDAHQRVMPWRARRGQRPNPYHVWLSEIMLQQTTVATVGPYFMKFLSLWPRIEDLAAATQDEVLAAWAGLGYYARARNLHKCAQAVVARGSFPATVEGLLELPGVGPYTAAAVASIAFDLPAVAVDGNVERVVSRFFAITEPLPLSKPAIRDGAARLAKGVARPGDFTQAFMELGATVCTPRNPKCPQCPWNKDCRARILGIAQDLPAKLAKKQKPLRYGKVFYVTDAQGRLLLEKREEKGLYEGMYQLPTTAWLEIREEALAQKPPSGLAKAAALGVEVRHSFTHFDLILEICSAKPLRTPRGIWVQEGDLSRYAMPTLMKKALKLAVTAAGA